MHVDSESATVRDLVMRIGRTVQTHGGYVHPELIVRHRGPSLWISLPRSVNPHLTDEAGMPLDAPHPDAEPLLIIPNDLHIPVTDLDWEAHDTTLRYKAPTAHLSEGQRQILDAMVELFNAVDKVRLVGQAYAQHSLDADPELHELVVQARPRFDKDHPGASASPAESVMRSRLRQEKLDDGPVGFFMPMIDMLNHHPYGSRYRRTDDGGWRIDVHHPGPGDQVYVRYNKADALGVALGLGYPETATRYVSSVDCHCEVEGFGKVHVVGVSAQRRRIPRLNLTPAEGGWDILGLQLEAGRVPQLLTLMAMPLMSRDPQAGWETHLRAAGTLLDTIVTANDQYYRRLLSVCNAPPGPQADPELRALFGAVAQHQLQLLSGMPRLEP